MATSGPVIELRRLERFLRDIESRYLTPHLQTQTLRPPSRDEELDVAAFVVLAHGALENFAEGLAIWIAGRVEANWLKKRRLSRSSASLLLRLKYQADDETDTSTVFDVLRRALFAAKVERSAAANANNGVTPKHLRSLLAPLGVDLPSDATLVASLEGLVSTRHEWAHQYRFGAKTPRTAGDMKKIADDCRQFAKQLAANVLALRLK